MHLHVMFPLFLEHRKPIPYFLRPGAVARSETCPLGMEAALSSIPTFGTFFRGDLVMKKNSTAILSLPLIQEEQLSVTGEIMCTKYW